MIEKWTLEKIRIAVERFKEENFYYPSTVDFDKTEYLPTSKMVQRNYGGISKLRATLGLDTIADYTKGEYRSAIAKRTYAKSIEFEETFYNYLISRIPEVRIHEHKILRPGHVCCDFFIYRDEKGGVAIDIFYAQDMFSLSNIVNIKQKRYLNLNCKVFFVLVGNEAISQRSLADLEKNKKNKLQNIHLVTETFFKENLNKIMEGIEL